MQSLVLENFIPYRIVVLGDAMGRALESAYRDEDVSIPEWRVLAVIAQVDSLAARDVVARTPMDKMTVSRAIASLEKKAYARREVSASDRRVNMISLTPAGRALFNRIAALALSYEEGLVKTLTAEERKHLDRALSKLAREAGGVDADRA
jgi:DNA-binding MarR family transcriptional regulator